MLDESPRGIIPAAGELSPEDLPLPDELEELVGELHRRGLAPRVRVSLFCNRGDGWEQLHTFDTLEEVGFDPIREAFGPGKYKIQVRGTGGRVLKQPTFRIGGAARETAAAANPNAELVAMMGKVLDRLERAPAAAAPATDLIVGLATAFSSSQAPLLAALAQMQRPEGPSPAEQMEAMLRMFKMGRSSAGGGKSEGGYGDVINDLGRPLLGMLGRMTGAPAHELEALPNPPEEGAASVAAAAAPTGAPGWYTMLAPALPQLLQLAALRGDVEYWSNQVVENADDAQLEWIGAELDRREEFEREFYQLVPQAVPHRAWFTKFWDAVETLLPEETDAE